MAGYTQKELEFIEENSLAIDRGDLKGWLNPLYKSFNRNSDSFTKMTFLILYFTLGPEVFYLRYLNPDFNPVLSCKTLEGLSPEMNSTYVAFNSQVRPSSKEGLIFELVSICGESCREAITQVAEYVYIGEVHHG